MKNKLIQATFFLSILYTQCLLAEATREVDRQNQIDNANPNGADFAQAQQVGGDNLADAGTIVRDEKAAPTGGGEGTADRAYKARNAKQQGNVGTAAAIVAAAGLAADSAAAFGRLQIGLGAALAAMSALETAQAIATASTATDNDAQDKQITTNESIGSNESRGSIRDQNNGAAITPELEATLRKQGVNVEQFKEKMASGAFTRVEDVIDAMGMSGKVSEYDIKQAERIADKTIREAANQAESEGGKGALTGNESAGGSLASSGISGVHISDSSRSANGSDALRGASVIETLSKENKTKVDTTNSGIMATGGTMSEFMSKFSSENKKGLLERKLSDYEIQMEKANIFPAVGKAQIFQIAHRNYREFGKWRKNTKLAIR